ncbi:hypothetical protein ACOMHN_065914 [Nucella lapillus]
MSKRKKVLMTQKQTHKHPRHQETMGIWMMKGKAPSCPWVIVVTGQGSIGPLGGLAIPSRSDICPNEDPREGPIVAPGDCCIFSSPCPS